MKEGDIFRYTPADRWCRHGIAVVYRAHNNELRACDTYWKGLAGAPGDHDNVSLDKLEQQNFVGNRDEFSKSSGHEWALRANSDRLHIPVGGWHEAYYIRTGSNPERVRAIEYLGYLIDGEESKIRSCQYRIEQLRKELATIDAPEVIA